MKKGKVITFDEIMLRLLTPGYLRFNQATEFNATYGGGEDFFQVNRLVVLSL